MPPHSKIHGDTALRAAQRAARYPAHAIKPTAQGLTGSATELGIKISELHSTVMLVLNNGAAAIAENFHLQRQDVIAEILRRIQQ